MSALIFLLIRAKMEKVAKKSKKVSTIPVSNTHIEIKGARVHNLKNVDLKIPKNKLVVVTGVSGSGKSSLVMDVLFAEGQRKYVESLSSYARQFLMRMDKPDIDYIKGICPAIAIEQKVNTKNARSTVGTLTEIYDYFKLLFARIGKTYSPVSGEEVKKHTISDIVDYALSLVEGAKVYVLVDLKSYKEKDLKLLIQKGFSRLVVDDEIVRIDELKKDVDLKNAHLLIDRFVISDDETLKSRIADSASVAFFEGEGICHVSEIGGKTNTFSNRFELDGMTFEEPSPHFFSFNNPYGACNECEGFGSVIGIDKDLVIPDSSLSVYEGAVACWRGEKMKKWKEKLVKTAMEFDFPIHRAYQDLTLEEKELVWTGNKHFKGINKFFEHLESKAYKIQYRVLLARYRGRTACQSCKGTRIRKDTDFVKIGGKNITDLLLLPIWDVIDFFDNLKLSDYEAKLTKRILSEIKNRVRFIDQVGLGYLTLNRQSGTLSGGETQRINLTRILGSNLTSSLYILDEPSIGLHPRDTAKLVEVLKRLRDLGNTVIVVEHEEEIMRQADYIIDMGPLAGSLGGEVVFDGDYQKLAKDEKSLTGKYLTGKENIALPKHRRKPSSFIELIGAKQNNLKNIDTKFPLNAMTVVTGVSGSGKTTLIKQILYPVLKREYEGVGDSPGKYSEIKGSIKSIEQIELIDQNPLGRSSRSNPVTYVKAYDAIRDLYSKQPLAKMRGFKPKHFSFNVEGGRCEVCKGDGEVVVEMQFLADIHLTCESCNGNRFKPEVTDVRYNEKSISEILDMTISEAMKFFSDKREIISKLKPLEDIGLGYIKLGQSSSTLSGGEAQRVKLASFLNKSSSQKPILFIFDEPTTGLHFNDINYLLDAFNALIDKGHSVIVIEHNLDVIKCADWIIDLGPEGGNGGGDLVFQGPPEDLKKVKNLSYTKDFLLDKLK